MRLIEFTKVEKLDIGQQRSFTDLESSEIKGIRQIRIFKDRVEFYFYDREDKMSISLDSIESLVVYSLDELSKLKDF